MTRPPILTVAVAATAALALTACGRSVPASGDVQRGPADGDAVAIVALDDEFQPDSLSLEAGTEVTIEVINEGDRPHNLVIDELDLSTGTLKAGEVATATFTVPDSAVEFHCSFHAGMTGDIQPSDG